MAVGSIQLLVVVELRVCFSLAVDQRPPPVSCLVAFSIGGSQVAAGFFKASRSATYSSVLEGVLYNLM